MNHSTISQPESLGRISDRNRILDALNDSARQEEARFLMSLDLSKDASTVNYHQWSRQIPKISPIRKIAICSSFTVRTLDPFLNVESFLSSWSVDLLHLEYLQWQAALAEPKKKLLGVDAVVLLLDSWVIESLYGGRTSEALQTLSTLLGSFRQQSKIPLFIGLVPAPPHSDSTLLSASEQSLQLKNVALLNGMFAEFITSDRLSLLIDVPSVLATVGPKWHDTSAMDSMKIFVSELGMSSLARKIARSIGPMFVPPKKVLVTDLDNTLWGGVLGEIGPEKLATGRNDYTGRYRQYQKLLKNLRSRGIILAIASKNNESDVIAAFSHRAADIELKLTDFTEVRINWNEKHRSIVEIAERLNVGLDSIVFVDDSNLECNLIRQGLPSVATIHAPIDNKKLACWIKSSRYFDSWVTSSDDIARANLYLTSKVREVESRKWTDQNKFLESLELQLIFDHLNLENQERIHQLLLKTNQFHLTLERPSLKTILDRAALGNQFFAFNLVDKFGDYGITGVMELEIHHDTVLLKNWAISCRAFGRNVEDGCISLAHRIAVKEKKSKLLAEHIKGPRNTLVEEHLVRLGFNRTQACNQSCLWEYITSHKQPEEIISPIRLTSARGADFAKSH